MPFCAPRALFKAATYSCGLVLLAVPLAAHAATLTLPSRGPYTVGQTFSIPVYVSTRAGEAMNAVSGTISYPADKLQAVSVSKGPIVNFWTQEPSVSRGNVVFEGGIYNPGFSGTSGTIITITFKVVAQGQAPLTFSSASVLANDGQGTNILDSATGATVALSAGAAPVAPVATVGTAGLVIRSSTHPDPTAWYAAHAVSLSWHNPPGTTAVRIGYDKVADGQPTVVYTPPLTRKDLTLEDGVWYFHVQAKTADGWGKIATFPIRIDSQPPMAIHIVFPHGATTTDPRPIALFNTTDDLSGIAYYEVKTNGTGLVKVSTKDVSSNPYALPSQDPGTGHLIVTAYDQAGNAASGEADYQVLGLAAPTLDPIPDLTEGDLFQITGITYPNSRVDAYLTDQDGKTVAQWTRTSGNGAFRVLWDKRLTHGVYRLYAQTTDELGAKSDKTDPISFVVKREPLLSLGWLTLNIISLILISAALLAALGLAFWYLWHRFHAVRRHILHRADPIHRALHREFEELKDAIAAEIAGLEEVKSRRQLNAEEDRLLERLTALVDHSEKVIEREMAALSSKARPSRMG